MKQKKTANVIKIVIILLMLCACIASAVFILGRQGYSRGPSPEMEDPVTPSAEGAEAPAAEPDGAEAVIFAASDYQADSNFDAPEQTLHGLLNSVKSDGKAPGAAIICGDYTNDAVLHDYQLSPEDSIAEIRGVLSEEAPSVKEENTLFVQGNHDALTESISESGLHELDSYLVYVLNTENDFPWKQGKGSGNLLKVSRTASEMKKCFDKLIADGETRPIIIAGHVPLHFTARTSSRHTTGDNLYSALVFDAVNKAAEDLDIIYLYGHNHSKGWDCYLGGSCVYRQPGDKLLLPLYDDSDITSDDFEEKTLNFTYMNAGYTGYYMNCAPGEYSSDPDSQYRAADETLTCSVIEIYSDRIVITRYDENGVHALGSAGEADPYKGGVDDGLIGPEHYSTETASPAVIERRTVKEQEELQDAA
ncbi:MAG: metallophosphoesterase [Mogibacterium sp.]|nr:metallophosphoesterase [Mogibacterium sp.]